MIGKTLTIKEIWNKTGKPVKVVLLVTVIMTGLIINSWGEDALSVIHERTSIRKFTSQPVEEGKVETLLRAAMAAATSRNIQPWRFWVVTDTNILQELAENLSNTHEPLSTAPLAIVVAGDTEAGYNNEEQMRNLKLDCSIASENLLLAAQAIGLGAVWMGIYPYNDRIVTLRNTLSLP
ncbi:MAG: nitroreductase family protein, partial [Desulfobacteraceae bacterium]|nr:nitroreductase family protein [Desulfobacteraceae bacterium]